MTREIRKYALAESDLIGIWEFTFHEWAAAQADEYLDELDDGIKELADNSVGHTYHPCALWPDGPREAFIALNCR